MTRMAADVVLILAFAIVAFAVGWWCGFEDGQKREKRLTTAEMKRRQKVKVLKMYVPRPPLSEEEWATKEYASQLLERARKV